MIKILLSLILCLIVSLSRAQVPIFNIFQEAKNKWLSEQLGVGQATISKWVQNNAQPNLEMLIKLSKILDVDINELIRPDEVQIDTEV